MSKLIKNSRWKSVFNNWVSENIPEDGIFLNVDTETLFPVILRSIINTVGPAVIITPSLAIAENISAGLPLWGELSGKTISPVLIPETEEGNRFIPENEFQKIKALYLAASGQADCFVTSATSFICSVPPADSLLGSTLKIKTGASISLKLLLENLVKMDYDDEIEVNVPGEFSRRGGIIDIFSPGAEFPARIELWGDEITSIRLFSAETQLSLRNIPEYTVIPRNAFVFEKTEFRITDYFKAEKPVLIIVHPEECLAHIERFGSDTSTSIWDETVAGFEDSRIVRLLDAVESSKSSGGCDCGCIPPNLEITKTISGETDAAYSNIMRKLTVGQVESWISGGFEVALLGTGDHTTERIFSWCSENKIKPENVEIDSSFISSGFIFNERKLAVLTEKELFFIPHARTPSYTYTKKIKDSLRSAEIANFADIEEGDHVVHMGYGIGIFRGIMTITEKGISQEMFQIEFADNVFVYVPLWHADMVSRYTGSKKIVPTLSKVGGRKCAKAKLDAVRSVRGLAVGMLRIQAMRSHNPGFPFPKDGHEQQTFEELFRFPETPDQRKSTDEIKKDMCSPIPMDRLLCGDVGYGKTEVAIRAAFKAVMAGKQVAVLVPTTVLAQQHFYTFSERFAEYPVIIQMLSRFKTHGEQKTILKELAEGKIDIIIGTHRIVQKDVSFPDLGLIIIDEEQRFGVEHKEKLKQLRATVDILTMTATPIPRTLYMSMTGIRDLSTIMTPPGLRMPVQTMVCKYDEKNIRDALTREIQRGGQVFYLHNRISSIENTCNKLKMLVPGAKFAIAHGRMAEHELEKVMTAFLDGKTDVLVCTTIIESGLDIPNANTIIIERADRFGLAELYQLRGRVGRWTRQAYAYLLLPPHSILSGNVRERISAIRRYTQLGAGFKLALRDLEIRGAGNILGEEQSGHINKIGFDLYCSFLKAAVAELKGNPEKVVPQTEIFIDFIDFAHSSVKGRIAAALPPDYIPFEKLRVDVYRSLSRASDCEELEHISHELVDRYGKIPVMAQNLIKVYKIRLSLAKSGYKFLTVRNNEVIIGPDIKTNKDEAKFYLKENNPDKKFGELFKLLTSTHSHSGE
ncbi:MAG: transcription-repair coupling factor [Victivallales bacterium]|jgi:transcription-repair coupling factor (superfamily II helicase)